MLVRKAEPKDVQQIVDAVNLLNIEIPDFVWNTQEFVAKQVERGEYFLIEEENAVAGVISLRQRKHRIHIETLVVKKEFQSKGLGTALIDFAKQYAKEKGFDTLHAYSFMEYKIADFYVKKGFKMLDCLGYYNQQPYHCFEMKLS